MHVSADVLANQRPIIKTQIDGQAIDGFEALLDAHIRPIGPKLIAERNRLERLARLAQIGLGLLTLLTGALMIALIVLQGADAPLQFLFGPIVLGGLTMTIRGTILSGFTARMKSMIVPPLLAQFGEFTYEAKPKKKAYVYLLVKGLLPTHDNARTEDSVEGNYRGWPLSVMDITASRNRKNGPSTVFSGLIIKTPNAKPVEGWYGLFDNGGSGQLTGTVQGFGWEPIRLEGREFEDKFDFYGTDQIEGRKMMTPRRMVQLSAAAETMDLSSFRIIYREDAIYMAIGRDENWLDSAILAATPEEFERQARNVLLHLSQLFDFLDIFLFGDENSPQQ